MLHSKINDYYHGQDTPQSLQELILFLSDISNRHIHGLRDNDIWKESILTQDKSLQRLQNIKAGYGLLNCHCRYISQTANTLLKEIGIESRQVELLSGKHLEKDSRHIISEIIWQNSYFHADLDFAIIFNENLTYLSSIDIQHKMYNKQLNEQNIWRLTFTKQVDKTTHNYFTPTLQSNKAIIEIYQLCSQAIMIDNDISIADDKQELQPQIRSELVDSKKSAATFLTQDKFKKKYYSCIPHLQIGCDSA